MEMTSNIASIFVVVISLASHVRMVNVVADRHICCHYLLFRYH